MYLTEIITFVCRHVLVIAASVVSGHKIYLPRERIADKLEFVQHDPFSKHASLLSYKKYTMIIYLIFDSSLFALYICKYP